MKFLNVGGTLNLIPDAGEKEKEGLLLKGEEHQTPIGGSLLLRSTEKKKKVLWNKQPFEAKWEKQGILKKS